MTSSVTATTSTFSLNLAHHDPSYIPTSKFQTIDGLLKSHAAEVIQKPLVFYPKCGASDYEKFTGVEIDHFVDAAVQFYIRNGMKPADPGVDKAPVIGLLATSSFDYLIVFFALNRLGWTVLFLSTRLTAPAYARLLEIANCNQIITRDSNRAMIDQIAHLRPGCTSLPLLQRSDYRNVPHPPPFYRKDVDPVKESEKMAWILHSSGSTGHPKPIFLTNTACLANFRKSFGLKCFCVSPLFHSHALMEFGRAFYTQAGIYFGNHGMPITATNLVEALKVAKPDQVSAVPYVLQLLAEEEEGVELLAEVKLVLFGGSSCPDELGDCLVRKGVNLVANYGCTEVGQIMTSFRPPGDDEWQYLRLQRPAADFTLMDEIAPGVFECVALDGLPSKGPTTNANPPFSEKNPEGSYRSGDLFTRHPDLRKTNYYKYLARLDDRITLVNGEKILPIPIEGTIRLHNLVKEAVVFGFQQSIPGVLILRSDEKGLELSSEEVLDAVWPLIERANAQAESFSRVPKEMVVIKGPDVTYPKTDKGTFIRGQVYQLFADDINKAYEAFDRGGENATSSLKLDVPELEQYLLDNFRKELGVPIPSVDTDIFSTGIDSLQTTRLWRMLKKDLDLGEGGQTLRKNIVFETGTIKQLARHLHQLRTGEKAPEENDEIEVMHKLIERYSTFTKHFPTATQQPEKQVVIVTGATGNLGALVVAELVRRSDVGEVWALVRAPGQAAAGARLMASLSSRNINLTSSQSAKLFAVPSDFSLRNLGLTTHTLSHLLSNLTGIIHSAWAVNFNLGIRSFEQQHILGTYNLINLCLRSSLLKPARFFFCSSVSVASGTPKPAHIPESAVEDLTHAQTMGYGRSKLVTEHIVRNAMRSTGMHARVLRIGQLSGDTQSAEWNDSEAIALMVRSALATGCLPALDERPSWLPVDECARAIVELSTQTPKDGREAEEEDADLVYHLVNPQTFSFQQDFLPALQRSKMPKFEVVSPQEWLERLAASEQNVEKNPSVKLLDFWSGKYSGSASNASANSDEKEDLVFETTRTVRDFASLGGARDPVSEGLVERYVDAWMKKWSQACR